MPIKPINSRKFGKVFKFCAILIVTVGCDIEPLLENSNPETVGVESEGTAAQDNSETDGKAETRRSSKRDEPPKTLEQSGDEAIDDTSKNASVDDPSSPIKPSPSPSVSASSNPSSCKKFGGKINLKLADTTTIVIRDLIVEPEQSILVVTSAHEIVNGNFNLGGSPAIARLTCGGQLDETFGVKGWLRPIGTTALFDRPFAIRSANHIYVANASRYALPARRRLLVSRYLLDGRTDVTFGVQGTAAIENPTSTDIEVYSFALGSNATLFVGFTAFAVPRSFAGVFKLNATGALDSTFGTGGYLDLSSPVSLGVSNIISINANNELLVEVTSNRADNCTVANPQCGQGIVQKRLADGKQDLGYGVNGFVGGDSSVLSTPNISNLIQVANSKIIMTDQPVQPAPVGVGYRLRRYNADGSLDTGFGTNGSKIFALLTRGSVAATADGKIIISGYIAVSARAADGRRPVVMRLLSNGDVDPTFGVNGVFTDNPVVGISNVLATPMKDGRVIVAPIPDTARVTDINVPLYRLQNNGTIEN